MVEKKKIIYIEACDFDSFPLGGTLSFAKQFVKNCNHSLYLVGFCNEREQVGKWEVKVVENKKVNYFSISHVSDVKKSFLPKRLYSYFKLRQHLRQINKIEHDLVFTQTPQFVFLISNYYWKKFCFYFAGLGNSVGLSKYKFLRFLGRYYEERLFALLDRDCDIILAAADSKAIIEKTLKYNLKPNRIIFFPTRFDDKVFFKKSKEKLRQTYNYSSETKIIVTSGRLSYIKGWKLLIDSFRVLNEEICNVKLIFIGEGEDRKKIEEYAKHEILNNCIQLIGRVEHVVLSDYLNFADVFVMGSLVEGFPTSMVEAIACGKNVVSTSISGADDLIEYGVNGFILYNRDKFQFAKYICETFKLDSPNNYSIDKSQKLKSSRLMEDFDKYVFN